MARVLLLLLALLTLGLTAGPSFGQERLPRINPLTGKPFGPKAIAEYEAQMQQIAADEAAAREASEEAEKRWEEARARNADKIKAFDDAVEDWREANPAPAGTKESMVHTSYDNDTALAEGADITYFNRWNVPTHTVSFGPDGKPTGPVTQTQQGKAWETIGPHIPPGGGVAISYDKDFDDNEIIRYVRIFDKDGWVIATYDFNFDGIAWQGETFDVETGKRNGAFQDESLKPPKRTLGGPLASPLPVRFITGLCEACRAMTNEHNDLAGQINAIVNEMASLSEQHQHAYPPAQKPIRMRHEFLAKQLAALMPRFESLRARLYECSRQCFPPDKPPTDPATVATLPGAPATGAPQGPGGFALSPDSGPPIRPGTDAFPADNSDLEAIIEAAQAYLAAANCEGMACPVCDCDKAREAVQALSDMEQYLQAMQPYLEAGQADHFNQFKAQVGATVINGDQQARTIWAIGVHQTLQDFGSALLDIASVAGWAKGIATDPKSLDMLSPAEFLDRVNSFYQTAKDLESLTTTLAESESGKPAGTPVADLIDLSGGVDKDMVNNTTSTISDIRSIVGAALEHGKDWRKALKEGGALGALGQIAGRYLKAYSADVLKGRQQALNELLRDADAESLTQAQSFLDLVKAQNRRWLAEDALAAIRAAREAYTGCAYAACGPFTITRPSIPTFRLNAPGVEGKLAWGEALRWFNIAIAQTLPRMKPVPFHNDCPKDDEPRATGDPAAPQTPMTPQIPAGGPDLSRPPFEQIPDPTPPASFCSETDRVAYLNTVYNPAVASALANARMAQDHQAKLNALFTENMRANSPWWAAVRAERDAFEPISAATITRAEALRQMYGAILAVPVVPCPDAAPRTVTGPQTPVETVPDTPATPVKPADPDKPPCPPKEGRTAINVGPNSKVGSGAQLRSKVGGMAMGALMGAIGGGGGGGGGSDGPQLWTCKIKDSEYTVFDDPATGVSLKVGAKRAKGGKVVIFSEIARSPDKGTFQAAFLENPTTGETQAPNDVGPCDLWGEWKLTVSWTKTTYVDGQMVSQESGGWSKTGKFSIPGALSKVDAPDGLWKRMGFSNATNGAREMGMIFNVAPGGGPLTFVIHVTRPKGDPVMTVPFVLTMTEGPGGVFTFTKGENTPCPPDDVALAGPGGARTTTPPPAANPGPTVVSSPPTPPTPPASPGTGAATTPTPTTGLDSLPKPNTDPEKELHASDLPRLVSGLETLRKSDLENRQALEAARCKGPDEWLKQRRKYLATLRSRLEIFQRVAPLGKDSAAIQAATNAEIVRLTEEYLEVEAMEPPPEPKVCPPGGDTEVEESILDEIQEVLVPA